MASSRYVTHCSIQTDVRSYEATQALYTIIILVYYFVAVHRAHQIYNWIALLSLECVSVVFWLSTWSTLASWYRIVAYDYSLYAAAGYSHITNAASAYRGSLLGAMVLSVIQL